MADDPNDPNDPNNSKWGKPKLTVVPTIATPVASTSNTPTSSTGDALTDLDIQDLNVDKLRETMVKNIYVVEAALFQQAGYEYKRINNIRSLVSTLEADLFDPVKLALLSPDQKIKLYNNLTQNMRGSLDFLSHLHDNVTSGIDTLNKIEKLKTDTSTAIKKTEEIPGGTSALEDVKKMVLEKIKERSTK